MPADFLSLVRERVVVLDGAMGTSLHRHDPTDADWGGKEFMNLCDVVAYTHPEWVRDIHAGFLEVGCDAVETNTFNGSRMVLADFGIADKCLELNKLNVRLAREAVAKYSTPDRPRFVIGSVGPGTKQPSIQDASITATFDEVYDSYKPQMRGLLEGGVDAVLIETCFDILQAKICVICALDAMRETGVKVPLMVQVTILEQGKMLAGSDMGTAIATLETFPEVDVIGINCALGPADMLGHIKQLSTQCSRYISCLPNAGLPEMLNGKAHFPLSGSELTSWLERFVREYGVNIVGGCCGTTPEHMASVVAALKGVKPPPRKPVSEPSVTSLHSTVSLKQEPRPLLVGERTNTNGSRKFKQLLEKEDWDGLVDMAREQEREGVHVLDVCTAFVGRDEVRDMKEVVRRYNEIIKVPLMVDSTEVPVIEESLKRISGKAIINSVNLEEGRHKFDKIVALARRYGAALVCGCIDEHKGMARTAEDKLRVATRIYDICTTEYGIPPSDLIFDPLVLPVSTGQIEERRNGLETMLGIRLIKQNLPGALTTVGLSNVSFGLSPYSRQVVNSVFLHFCVEHGLDSAILHASKIVPLASIDAQGAELARRLIFAEYDQGNPLQALIEHYADKKAESKKTASLGETVEERLKQAIIQGRRESLIADLDLARERYSPLDVINTVLLDAMKVVGDLFGSGQMQLPFVLQSAEVMKASVAYLEKFMEKVEGSEKGKIVLATVKGDVHDIGKNLVDIILTNNGYKVYNLGIKQPIENILHAAVEHKADAIGMSGLLVKSTVVMREDLVTLNERAVTMPVILGGAALTRRYVEQDLRAIYKGPLYYGEDAFDGLRIMDILCKDGGPPIAVRDILSDDVRHTSGRNGKAAACCTVPTPRPASSRPAVRLDAAPNIPNPPFWGGRVVRDIRMEDVFPFVNQRTLFSTQWQFVKSGVSPQEYERQMRDVAEPALRRLQAQCLDENILRPAVAYGFFPCAADGDDLIVFESDRTTERLRFNFPRQDGGEGLCLSDYFAPAGTGAVDVVSFMAVTMGEEISRRTKELYEAGKYQDYLFLHGLGVEGAEALAEFFHRRIRQLWGIADHDATDVGKLFKKHYRGCRYSFGYPACPSLEDQTKLAELIPMDRVGMMLTESFQIEPEQSTTALIVHHPQAKYFNITATAGV